jgi:hypothetical protein
MANVTVTISREELLEELRKIPRVMAGDAHPQSREILNIVERAIGNAFLEKVSEAFIVKSLGGTDEAGIHWKPLHPMTVFQKGHDTILVDTGELLHSLRARVASAFQVFETEPGRVTVGTTRYPEHHTGDPSRNLPERPFWPHDGNLPPSWWDAIFRAVLEAMPEVIEELLRDFV